MTQMTPIKDAAFKSALQTYSKAEALWDAALEAKYGDDAGDARYDERGKGEEGSALRKLYDAYMAANNAWHALRDPHYADQPDVKA